MKSTTKILILMLVVSIIGIGTPIAFSIGGGQHQFTQIDPANPDAFCNKCHRSGDIINTELMASGNGIYNGGGRIHAYVTCVECHQLEGGMEISPQEKQITRLQSQPALSVIQLEADLLWAT